MHVQEEFLLPVGQGTKIRTHSKKILPNANTEYIHIQSADLIRIWNIFVVLNLTEYEYRIYSVLANWPNTNIEYIRNQKIEYSYSNI